MSHQFKNALQRLDRGLPCHEFALRAAQGEVGTRCSAAMLVRSAGIGLADLRGGLCRFALAAQRTEEVDFPAGVESAVVDGLLGRGLGVVFGAFRLVRLRCALPFAATMGAVLASARASCARAASMARSAWRRSRLFATPGPPGVRVRRRRRSSTRRRGLRHRRCRRLAKSSRGRWRPPVLRARADGRAGGERERKNDRHQPAGHAGE